MINLSYAALPLPENPLRYSTPQPRSATIVDAAGSMLAFARAALPNSYVG